MQFTWSLCWILVSFRVRLYFDVCFVLPMWQIKKDMYKDGLKFAPTNDLLHLDSAFV